jgi:hypothetical protein
VRSIAALVACNSETIEDCKAAIILANPLRYGTRRQSLEQLSTDDPRALRIERKKLAKRVLRTKVKQEREKRRFMKQSEQPDFHGLMTPRSEDAKPAVETQEPSESGQESTQS